MKFDPLAEYMRDINAPILTPEQKINRMTRNMTKNMESILLKIMLVSIGVYTLKVAVEQLIMQWRIHF